MLPPQSVACSVDYLCGEVQHYFTIFPWFVPPNYLPLILPSLSRRTLSLLSLPRRSNSVPHDKTFLLSRFCRSCPPPRGPCPVRSRVGRPSLPEPNKVFVSTYTHRSYTLTNDSPAYRCSGIFRPNLRCLRFKTKVYRLLIPTKNLYKAKYREKVGGEGRPSFDEGTRGWV